MSDTGQQGFLRSFFSPGVRLMLLSTLAYMGVNTCVKELSSWPTHQIILFRSVVSLVITVSYLLSVKHRPFFGTNHKWLIIRGFAGIGALYFYFNTLQRIPMASAVTIQYLSPIFTAIGAWLLLDERMKTARWLYFLVSFIGVLLVKGIDPRLSLTDVGIGVLGALCSGLAYTAIRKLGKSENAMVIVMYFPLIATPVTGIMCLFNWSAPTPKEWLLGLLMGLFTQAGQIWATKAVQSEPLNKVTYLNYLGVIYALAIGLVGYNETFDLISLAGMGLVILGVVMNLIDQDKRRRLKVKVIKRQMARPDRPHAN